MAGRPIIPLISASLLLLVIIPLLILALASGTTVRSGLMADLSASLGAVVNAAALETERSIYPIGRVIDALGFFIAGHPEPGLIADFMDAEQRARSDISSIVLIGKDNRVLAAAPRKPGILGLDYSGQPEIARARAGRGIVMSPPFIPPLSSQVLVAAYRQAGDFVISVLLDLEELSRFVKRLRLGDADHLYVVDGFGRVVAGTELAAVFEQRYLPAADLDSRDLGRTSLDGREHFVLARDIPTTGWRAVYYRDRIEALATARGLIVQLGIVASLAMAGAVAAAMGIAAALARPFTRIGEEISLIAEGHYDRRIEGDWPLELDRIARSFNGMAERVREREAQLHEAEALVRHDRDEKVILLKEIHHRVKNNLQIIASLLRLQEQNLIEPRDVEMLRGSEDRIHSMALTHEILYQSADFSAIDMGDYAARLISYLRDAYGVPGLDISLDTESLRLPLEQATPLGLVLNELCTNAFKYALRDASSPRLAVRIAKEVAVDGGADFVVAEVRDNGPGLPEGLVPAQTETLGMSLIVSLVRQLGGGIAWFKPERQEAGLGVRVEFRIGAGDEGDGGGNK